MPNESTQKYLFGDCDRAASVPDGIGNMPSDGTNAFAVLFSANTVDVQILESVIQRDYLAKAFFLVCHYDSNSASTLPLLLRFENDDLLIWKSNSGGLSYALGAINTTEFVRADVGCDGCLSNVFQWKPDTRLDTLAGEMLTAYESAFQKMTFIFEMKVLTVSPSCISLTNL